MNLFKLDNQHPLTYPDGANFKTAVSNAPIAKPILGSEKIIDVVNDFKWTKTLKEGRSDIPTMRLRERYVTRSSFIGNLAYAANVFVDTTEIATEAIGNVAGDLPVVGDYIKKGSEGFKKFTRDTAQSVGLDNKNNIPLHLNSYYNLYGTKDTGFRYTLPYLQDDWKVVTSEWGAGMAEGLAKSLFSFTSAIVEGFSMESAKSYKFPEKGPSISTTLFLDNTKDVNQDGQLPSWQQNWQLIFLLVYQNLPNRLNRFLSQPSALYELKMDGLNYLPYCYIPELQVKCHGVRKQKTVTYQLNNETKEVKTLVPEVYELNLKFTSLIAESKNLFYESFSNNISFQLEE
tara:strand:- start:5113 stop:6147 length:1035 start_codon:yes stop_codon:yes gene_type:complete